MLTQRQLDLLTYISGHVGAKRFAPTTRDMAAAIGLRSTSGVTRLLDGLEERGFIRRLRGRARAVEVIRSLDMTVVIPADLAIELRNYADFSGTNPDVVVREALAAYLEVL